MSMCVYVCVCVSVCEYGCVYNYNFNLIDNKVKLQNGNTYQEATDTGSNDIPVS